MQLRRFLKSGAVFSEDLSSIQDLEDSSYTVAGNPTIVDSPYGKAMKFDGTGDYVTISKDDSYSYFEYNKSFSIICLFNSDSGSISRDLFSRSSGVRFYIASNGKLAVQIYDGTDAAATTSANAVNDGNWHVGCLTWDSLTKTVSVYVDNLPAVTDTDANVDTTLAADGTMYVGKGGANNWIGKVKNVLVFPRVLTATEALNFYKGQAFDYEKSLLSEWDMSNPNPPDLGWRNLGNNGTGEGLTTANIVDGFAGKKALRFNGSDEYVDSNFTSDLSGTGDFSVSIWVKTSNLDYALAQTHTIAGGYTSDWIFGIGANIFWMRSVALGNVSDVNDDKWHQILMCWDISEEKYDGYVDGVSVGTSATVSDYGGMDSVKIGTRGDASSAFCGGDFGNLTIFDKKLNALEARDWFEKTRSRLG